MIGGSAGFPYLLGVAVRRARELGRGGIVTDPTYRDPWFPPHVVHDGLVEVNVYTYKSFEPWFVGSATVLAPELADVYKVLRRVLDKARRFCEAYRGKIILHDVSLEFLPLELQVALKRLAEVAATVALDVLREKDEVVHIGYLLVACNPRAEEVEIDGSQWSVGIRYDCRPHTDDKIRLKVDLAIREPPYIGVSIYEPLSP
jgi:hypothetical protein